MLLLLLGVSACGGSDVTLDNGDADTEAALGWIKGSVHYAGAVPDADTPDNAGTVQPMLEVDASEDGLRYAVVYLVGISPQEVPRSDAPEVGVDQQDLEFQPRVTAVRAGMEIRFGNTDPENHNVRAQTRVPRNAFNIVTSSGGDYWKVFQTEPDFAPILLACDIHAWMRGWVYVFDHPYFAVTNRQGRFSIGPLPAGTYQIQVRQPDGRLRADGEIRVESGGTKQLNIGFTTRDLAAAVPIAIGDTP